METLAAVFAPLGIWSSLDKESIQVGEHLGLCAQTRIFVTFKGLRAHAKTDTMKNIVGIALSAAVLSSAWAQSEKPDMHWYHSAPSKTNMGISLDEAYQMGLPAKKQIIVAVVDGGTDVNHEDLNEVLWTNPGEIAGN